MSVILYEDEKFFKVAKELKLRARDIAYLWAYPDRWNAPSGMDSTIEQFVNDLRNANIAAYNNRYSEKEKPVKLNFMAGSVTIRICALSTFELIKSLKGIAYNCVETNQFDKTLETLRNVIYHLMSEVLNAIPEYEKAKSW